MNNKEPFHPRNRRLSVLLLSLCLSLAAINTVAAGELNLQIASVDYPVVPATVATYVLGEGHPGMGMQFMLEADWFVFGEARLSNYQPLAAEAQLFEPEQPRTIVIGGGIRF